MYKNGFGIKKTYNGWYAIKQNNQTPCMEANARNKSSNNSFASRIFVSTQIIQRIISICEIWIDFLESRPHFPENFLEFRLNTIEWQIT